MLSHWRGIHKKEKGSVVAVIILLCYAPEDKGMAGKLKKHLSVLEKTQFINIWDYGDIRPGAEWEQEMKNHLNKSQMILLLISADFLASHYCYNVQMQRAIERHEHKEARVIPILLRSVYWQEPPLDKLQALPDEKKPISRWAPQDDGFTNVVGGIAKVVKQWNEHSLSGPTAEREVLMANLDHLIESVKLQLQPPVRALATANTLQQLSIFIPNDVTLADLVVGWRTLSQPTQQVEEPATTQRRVTCGELANVASQFTTEQGNVAQAIKTWQAWQTAFKKSDDPRQNAMASTFARELGELQTVAL